MAEEHKPLPPMLEGIHEALREAERAVQEVRKKPPTQLENLVSLVEVPETVRRIREARAKRALREAEKKRRHKERWIKQKKKRHPTQKRAKKRDWKYGSLKAYFNRWKNQTSSKGDRSQLTYEEFAHVMGRYAPYGTGATLWEWARKNPIVLRRKDTKKPWTLMNIHPKFRVGSKHHDWRKLKKVPLELL